MTQKSKSLSVLVLSLVMLTGLFPAFADDDMSQYVTSVEYDAVTAVTTTCYDLSAIPIGILFPNEENELMNKSLKDPLNILKNASLVADFEVSVNFLYNDVYHEKILKFGETLTIETAVKISTGSSKAISLFVGAYQDGRLVNIVSNDGIISSNGTHQFISVNLPLPSTNTAGYEVRAFVWDKTTLQPCTESVSITETGTQGDYYSTTAANANFMDYTKTINGRVHDTAGTDYIAFKPKHNGTHIFVFQSSERLFVYLHNQAKTIVAMNDAAADDGLTYLQYPLSAGETYYIRILGMTTADYSVNVYLPTYKQLFFENEKIDGTMTGGVDFYSYNFSPPTNGTYVFTVVGNTEVKGLLYRNGTSMEPIVSSVRDGNVSFRITQDIGARQTWYIVLMPKTSGVTGNYSLYVEQPLTVTVN